MANEIIHNVLLMIGIVYLGFIVYVFVDALHMLYRTMRKRGD